MNSKRAQIVVAIAAGWLGAAGVAQAQTGDASTPPAVGSTTRESDMADVQARSAFRLGSEHYAAGRFQDAALEFERAYALSGRPQLLYNAYLAYRDAQDTDNGARTLRAYLASVPDAADRALLESRLASLDEQIRERQSQEAMAQAAADEAQRRIAEAEARAVEAAASVTREVPGEVWPWIVTSVGGAAIIGGAITGGLALSASGQLEADCGGALHLCPEGFDLAGRQAGVATLAGAADGLIFGGAAIAAFGVAFGIALGPHLERVPATMAASCTGDGCALVARGAF